MEVRKMLLPVAVATLIAPALPISAECDGNPESAVVYNPQTDSYHCGSYGGGCTYCWECSPENECGVCYTDGVSCVPFIAE